MNKDPTAGASIGPGNFYRPDRPRFTRGNEKSIVNSIYNRIAIDVASIDIMHVQLDEQGRYQDTKKSALNNCLTVEANIDQTGRAFMQDVVMSLLDEGVVAIVPIDTTTDITKENAFDINSMRTAKVIDWYPRYVKVNVYNDRTAQK